ncbi:MAG: ABC transporter permease subunit [Acidimicrobiia bacterium]|nr:ABC transporter permease subunit [Acidimicrobiia bacterium]
MSERLARPAAIALVGVLLVFPLGRLVFEALFDAGPFDVLARPGVRTAVFNSIWSSVAAATLALLAGAALAYVTDRLRPVAGSALRAAVVATLIIPPFVSALSWQATFAPFGLLDDLTGLSLGWVEGRAGVVVVLAVNSAPLAFLIVAAALRSSRAGDLDWSARAAGAGPGRVLRQVTIPLIRPALVGGWLVGFAAALSSFGVPIVLGSPAGFHTLTTRVFQAVAFSAQPGAFGEAVMLATMLAGVALVVVVVSDAGIGRTTMLGDERGPIPPTERAPAWASLAAWTYVAVTLVVPLGGLVLRAVTKAIGLSAAPANWTLANFSGSLDARTWEAFGRSALLAATAAIIAVLVAGLFVHLERRGAARWGPAALVMFAVPGTSVAIAMSIAYGRWLANTVLIIVIAYVAKLLALAHRPLSSAIAGLHANQTRAAAASGASPGRTLRRIVTPLMRPALVAGWLLVFVFAVHELTISSLLHGPGTETLAVVILDYQQIGDPTATAALAVVLAGVVGAVALPLVWLQRAWQGTR